MVFIGAPGAILATGLSGISPLDGEHPTRTLSGQAEARKGWIGIGAGIGIEDGAQRVGLDVDGFHVLAVLIANAENVRAALVVSGATRIVGIGFGAAGVIEQTIDGAKADRLAVIYEGQLKEHLGLAEPGIVEERVDVEKGMVGISETARTGSCIALLAGDAAE